MSSTSDSPLDATVPKQPVFDHPSSFFPPAPKDIAELGEIGEVASNQAIKIAAGTPTFTTEWMTQRLKLSHRTVEELLWNLKQDKILEVLGQTGPLSYKYSITKQGLELAKRLMDICGYLGPTPVSLTQYQLGIESQSVDRSKITLDDVMLATSDLTLSPQVKEIAALAVASGRSLFVFGPAGNGKSSLGRLLHSVVGGHCWIPYSIAIEGQVIRIYDPQVHVEVDIDPETEKKSDGRWICVERPMIISGGEMTMSELDLAYDSSTHCYEAPPHIKANCGTYFIDDLGRQRVDPHELLNRWIIPLEHRIDFLSLHSGQKIQVPFRMMLIVATNLKTKDVADAAFLRRMGYRLHLGAPTEPEFREIIRKYARTNDLDVPDTAIDHVVQRYQKENRPWRASEPRDLLERCRDICGLRNIEYQVDEEILDVAWRGYFSNVDQTND